MKNGLPLHWDIKQVDGKNKAVEETNSFDYFEIYHIQSLHIIAKHSDMPPS